jgi:hypothetical protein
MDGGGGIGLELEEDDMIAVLVVVQDDEDAWKAVGHVKDNLIFCASTFLMSFLRLTLTYNRQTVGFIPSAYSVMMTERSSSLDRYVRTSCFDVAHLIIEILGSV